MSSLVLTGDTSGAITVSAPAVAGTNTLTLPAITATLNVQGPAFSAYQSTLQTLSSSTNTKILFQTEEFDTNSNFASSTFTPTVAGYYQITGAIRIGGSATQVRTFIYKNGTAYKLGTDINSCFSAITSTLVYLNGSTDYVEFYAVFATGQNTSAAASETWFNGCLIRGA